MKQNIVKKRAFTLIELLIVIAIIGILFVVLVSRVDFATDKAKATGAQTDFRSFQMAFETVSKENAGFASLGWNTGDDNGDRKRNSYDEGDIGTGVGTPGYHNGKVDSGEIWTGHKVYGETWGSVYTLVNPADNTDASAFQALEAAINANLDPKLHITITPELSGTALTGNAVVTMANGAQDPWKKEYHGVYITNAVADNGADRGAFVIYSDGANGKNGSAHLIDDGIVTVTVPGNNIAGKDDYAIVVCYTNVNGYGESRIATFGFSNNQKFFNNDSHNNDITQDDIINAGLINFNVGTFESSTEYTPGVFEEISYEVSKTREKKPVASSQILMFSLEFEGTDLDTLDPYLHEYKGQYIVYRISKAQNNGNGSFQTHADHRYIYNLSDDTLENAIYLAACVQKSVSDANGGRYYPYHIAEWNGSAYVKVDYRSQIDAITDFTETYTETVTETVAISQPAFNTEYVYVPSGTMQAEPGMTWAEWINSSYNVLDYSVTNVWTSDYQEVSLDSLIVAEKSYAFKAGGSAMTMNEYGFYFNQPYVARVDGMDIALIFYEDGKMSMWSEMMLVGMLVPEEEGWKPMIGSLPFSEDGMSFELDGVVCTLNYTNYRTFAYDCAYKAMVDGNVIELTVHQDGSVDMISSSGETLTLPANSFVVDGQFFTISDGTGTTLQGAIYPDSSKITFGEVLLVADVPRTEKPSISLNNGTLTINHPTGGCQYKIFIDDILYTTTTSRSVDLSSALRNKDNVFVSVKATATDLADSLCSSIWVSSTNKIQPGLYNDNDKLLTSWASLILDYGLILANDYQNFPSESGHTQNVAYSLENIMKKPELSSGTKLIIGFCDWIGDFSLSTENDQLTYVMLSSTVQFITDSPCIYKDNCYLDVDPDNSVYYIQDGCVIDRTTKTLIWGNKGCTVPTDGSVLIIGNSAFSESLTTTHLIVANGVERLSYYAYGDNDTITTVTLPVTLKQIDSGIFRWCDSLTTIIYEGTVEQWKQIKKSYDWNYKDWHNKFDIAYVQCSDGIVNIK